MTTMTPQEVIERERIRGLALADERERDELESGFASDAPPGATAAAPRDEPWVDRIASCEATWFTQRPPNHEWLLRDERAGGAGVLALGKVGMLFAEGGAGKTMALVQLALAVASHEPMSWLGCYSVPNQGRVLLLFGEEDREELLRRFHNAWAALASSSHPLPEPSSIVTLGLTGLPCAMIEADERSRELRDSAFLVWLRSYVKEHGPFVLVVVDPLSRFAGADAETDNAAATRFVQGLESIASETGATVIAAHHTNKTARGAGAQVTGASGRGSSAFFDGARWVCTLAAEPPPPPGDGAEGEQPAVRHELVTFAIAKSNYSRKGAPLTLRRDLDHGGALLPLAEHEREAAWAAAQAAEPSARRRAEREAEREARTEREAGERAQRDAEREVKERARTAAEDAAVVASVAAEPGASENTLAVALRARLGSCGTAAARAAVRRAVMSGRILVRPGPKNSKAHHLQTEPGLLPDDAPVLVVGVAGGES